MNTNEQKTLEISGTSLKLYQRGNTSCADLEESCTAETGELAEHTNAPYRPLNMPTDKQTEQGLTR